MKKTLAFLLATGAVLGGQIAYAQQANSLKAVLFAETNRARASVGSSPVSFDPTLENVAQVYACMIVSNRNNPNSLSHTGLDGTSPQQRAAMAGYSGNVGENLARGTFFSPVEVVTGWMNSPRHRVNLVNPQWTKMGLGHCQEPDSPKTVWVQLLGN